MLEQVTAEKQERIRPTALGHVHVEPELKRSTACERQGRRIPYGGVPRRYRKSSQKRLSGPFVEFSGEGQSSIGDGWHTERISTQLRRVVPRMVPSVSMVPSTQAGIHAVGARCCLPRTAKPYGPPAVVVGPHTPLDTVRRMQGASGSDHRALHDRRSVTRMGTEQRSQS
eukprot:scaffold9252_cov34-Tisochrysis_lutea.AAC.4